MIFGEDDHRSLLNQNVGSACVQFNVGPLGFYGSLG